MINKTKNLYSKYCIKSINYLNSGKCLNDIKKHIPNENSASNFYAHLHRERTNEDIESLIKLFKNWILLSLYFNEYEYLVNIFSYQEIKELFIYKDFNP